MNIEQIAQKLEFDVEDMGMLLEVFFQSANESLEKLYVAIEQNDLENIAFFAHAIKGSAANLTLEDISKKALFIEKSAKAKESIEYKEYVDELQGMIQKLQ